MDTTTHKKLLRYLAIGVAYTVLFIATLGTTLAAICFGFLALTSTGRLYYSVLGGDETATFMLNVILFFISGVLAFLFYRLLVGSFPSSRTIVGGQRPVATAGVARHIDARRHGIDIGTLAADASPNDPIEAQRIGDLLAEQVRTGQRVKPSEGVMRHEAAHAIVAHDLGITVTEIRIAPTNGHIITTDATLALTPDERYNALTMFLAGPTAYSSHGYENDTSRANALATAMLIGDERPTGYVGDLTVDGLLLAARDRAREILARRADDVDRLLAAMKDSGLDYRTIRGDELQALLAPAATSELVAHA